jgi:hypothetical protein
MASYGMATRAVLRAVVNAFGAEPIRLGSLVQHGHPALEAGSLLLLIPIVESLILIGMIELLHWLRSPSWLEVSLPAILSAALHLPVSHAIVVAPSWFIMAWAYVFWRRVSWKVGFAIIASIHALLNLTPAISVISYAVHHANA